MNWLGLVGVALGVVGAIAFLLAYGDRQRLKETIESYQTTVDAYKEELVITKEENKLLRSEVDKHRGAIQVLTETVTQSAKVEMFSHNSSDQHRLILLKLEEIRVQFAPLTLAVLGRFRDSEKGTEDGTTSSVSS